MRRTDLRRETRHCAGWPILLQCRASDTPARLQAGEFAVVLPDTSAEGAHTMGLRMAAKIELDIKGPALSCSFGTAIFPSDGKNLKEILVWRDAVCNASIPTATKATRTTIRSRSSYADG